MENHQKILSVRHTFSLRLHVSFPVNLRTISFIQIYRQTALGIGQSTIKSRRTVQGLSKLQQINTSKKINNVKNVLISSHSNKQPKFCKRVLSNILEGIGMTPLVRLNTVPQSLGIKCQMCKQNEIEINGTLSTLHCLRLD